MLRYSRNFVIVVAFRVNPNTSQFGIEIDVRLTIAKASVFILFETKLEIRNLN